MFCDYSGASEFVVVVRHEVKAEICKAYKNKPPFNQGLCFHKRIIILGMQK